MRARASGSRSIALRTRSAPARVRRCPGPRSRARLQGFLPDGRHHDIARGRLLAPASFRHATAVKCSCDTGFHAIGSIEAARPHSRHRGDHGIEMVRRQASVAFASEISREVQTLVPTTSDDVQAKKPETGRSLERMLIRVRVQQAASSQRIKKRNSPTRFAVASRRGLPQGIHRLLLALTVDHVSTVSSATCGDRQCLYADTTGVTPGVDPARGRCRAGRWRSSCVGPFADIVIGAAHHGGRLVNRLARLGDLREPDHRERLVESKDVGVGSVGSRCTRVERRDRAYVVFAHVRVAAPTNRKHVGAVP